MNKTTEILIDAQQTELNNLDQQHNQHTLNELAVIIHMTDQHRLLRLHKLIENHEHEKLVLIHKLQLEMQQHIILNNMINNIEYPEYISRVETPTVMSDPTEYNCESESEINVVFDNYKINRPISTNC